jgi:hypothetical protein
MLAKKILAKFFLRGLIALSLFVIFSQNAYAQMQLQAAGNTPLGLPNHASELIAQVSSSPPATRPSSSDMQVDLAPLRLPERGGMGNFQGFKTNLFYKLPSRMFFNLTVENSGRVETNIFQQSSPNKTDFIYRVLPNVTLGYALTKKTRVAANYFFFRDQYARYTSSMSRNIHSVGGRIDHDFQITPKTTLTTSMFARELFITHSANLTDLLPSVTVVRRTGQRGILYGSVIGQLRFHGLFDQWQEGDQFYSFGGVYRSPMWTFSADNTFITNFGKRSLRGGPNNQMFILTFEAGRKLHKRLPLTAFMRAEPIFNIGANQAAGFAGFNFRLFGGLRMELNKAPIFPIKLLGG